MTQFSGAALCRTSDSQPMISLSQAGKPHTAVSHGHSTRETGNRANSSGAAPTSSCCGAAEVTFHYFEGLSPPHSGSWGAGYAAPWGQSVQSPSAGGILYA